MSESGASADVSVRPGRLADAGELGELQAAVWHTAYAGHLPADLVEQLTPAAFADAWEQSLRTPPAPPHHLLVGLAGDRLVGYASTAPSPDPDQGSDVAELAALAVRPDARRQGHGSRLLNAAVDILRADGVTTLTAWVLVDQADTRDYLIGSGLRPDGAHRDRVVDDTRSVRETRLRGRLVPDADEPGA